MRKFLFSIGAGVGLVLSGELSLAAGARHPAILRTERDIQKTDATWYAISIGDLPLSLYPKLSKFREVEHVLYRPDSEGASDAKLKALAQLNFPKLRDVALGGSSSATDAGVRELARFSSLHWLQLSETSITDQTIRGLAQFSSLRGVNVVGCAGVTADGLAQLVRLRPWEELSFSAEKLSTAQVADLLAQLPPKSYCLVVDETVHLDEAALQKVAGERAIALSLRKDARYPKYK